MTRRFRLAGLALVVLAGLAAAACGDGLPSPPPGGGGGSSAVTDFGAVVSSGTAAQVVDATDSLKFSPATISVKVGDIVEWKNVSSVTHTVTFATDNAISTSNLAPGATFEVKFTKAGSFPYACVIHPGMDGTVKVS